MKARMIGIYCGVGSGGWMDGWMDENLRTWGAAVLRPYMMVPRFGGQEVSL
jgi:hypothetical protein